MLDMGYLEFREVSLIKIQLEVIYGSLILKAIELKRLSVSYLKCYHTRSKKRKSFDKI